MTTIPAAVAFMTAMQSGSVVDGSVTGCPSERLIMRILYLSRFAMTHSMPSMTSLVHPVPFAPRTRTLMSLTSGAMPPLYSGVVTYFDALLLPAMMPAMCVPCPCASFVEGSPAILLTLKRTFPFNAGCGAMPVSRIATVTPAPVTPGIAPRPSSNPP